MLCTPGGGARQITAIVDDGIQHLTIMGGDIFHVAHVLVAPFNFEGAYASIDQRTEVRRLIVIFHRQQVFFECHHAALIVFQGIRQTAGLRAVAPVSAAPRLGVRDITLPGIGHTQRTVDKEFNGRVGRLMDIADLVQVQLARQHNLRKPDVRKKLRLLDGADIALGAGVQLNRRDIQFQNAHILNDQGINAGLVEIGDQTLRGLQLIIMKNGVQGHKHLRPETVSERYQLGNVAQAVAGVMPGTEARAANVDGIRTVKNGFTGNGGVAGRA